MGGRESRVAVKLTTVPSDSSRTLPVPATFTQRPSGFAIPVKLLVCDDERVLRVLIRAALEPRGYSIVEAENGVESVDRARRERPDLIVLDMMMPGRSGLDVLAELRRDPHLVTTPVLMLSARTQAGDRAAAARAGADRFLAKPFSPSELASIVDELLEGGA